MAKKNNIEYIEHGVENAKEEWQEYYKPFAELDGCEVGFMTAFKAGSIYEQTNEPTHWVGWLKNEQGERHGWPQPVYIPDTVKTWGSKPEDIDPRLYFEPVRG